MGPESSWSRAAEVPGAGGPGVHVGIVSFDTADLLDRCLGALPAALGGLVATVTVVDNASTDDSVAVARRHPHVGVVENRTNAGYARAMNQALGDSDAPVLVALNPDTAPAPGSLAILTARVRAAGVGLAVPRLRHPDGSLQHSVFRFPSIPGALISGLCPTGLRPGRVGRRWWLAGYAPHDRPEVVDWAIGAVHAIRADALEDRRHPYPEVSFIFGEDMALCWSLRRRGWEVVFEPGAEVVHVGGAATARVWDAATREARVLATTYDWYVVARGRPAARAWAAANCLGLAVKYGVRRLQGDRTQAGRLARLLAIHGRALVRPGGQPRWRPTARFRRR